MATMISRAVIFFTAVCIFYASGDIIAGSFRDDQQRYPRVRKARENTETFRNLILTEAEISKDSLRIFIQAFKHEKVLELWGANCDTCDFKLLKIYYFTSSCGILGPKRAQGDLQIPDGFYFIDRFNPASSYHLSLGINYPNKSDRIRTVAANPGGDIFIHGNRVTIGCIPIGNSNIESLYIFAVDASDAGQEKIQVHIYPSRFDDPENSEILKKYRTRSPSNKKLWAELEEGYNYFKKHKFPPKFIINDTGEYIIAY